MDYYKLKVLNNRKIIIIVLTVISIIIFTLYYFLVYQNKEIDFPSNELIISEEDKSSKSHDDLVVDIKGHVNKPGVYYFMESDNPRIVNLIEKAGGLSKDADTSMINLSKKLEDEMIIIIYSKSEIANYVKTQDELRKKLEICENKLKNDACINEKQNTSNGKININEASVSELESLSGIGKSKAEAIVEYRKKNKYQTIEDIKNVEGIGDSLFESIKESITV